MVIYSTSPRVRWTCILVGSALALLALTLAWNAYLLPPVITPYLGAVIIIGWLGLYRSHELRDQDRPTAAHVVTVVAGVLAGIVLMIYIYSQVVGHQFAQFISLIT